MSSMLYSSPISRVFITSVYPMLRKKKVYFPAGRGREYWPSALQVVPRVSSLMKMAA